VRKLLGVGFPASPPRSSGCWARWGKAAGVETLAAAAAEVVTAARTWREAVRQLELLAQRPYCDLSGWDQDVRTADQARDAFYVAARRSLDVPGGSVAQSSCLSTR
jgi:hypothetical protein